MRLPPDPGLSGVARAWLLGDAAFRVFAAVTMWWPTGLFFLPSAAAYTGAKALAPIGVWGALFALTGAVSAGCVLVDRVDVTRWARFAGVLLLAVWVGALASAIPQGDPAPWRVLPFYGLLLYMQVLGLFPAAARLAGRR